MVMKKNFTKYIIVILFWTISLLLFLSSCITEKQGEGEIYFFVYKNNTSFLIKMESYTKDRLVDSLTITPLSSYETGAWENFFSESDYDYSKIVFDNKKYLIYDNNYGMSDNCQVVSKNPYCGEIDKAHAPVSHVAAAAILNHNSARGATYFPIAAGPGPPSSASASANAGT